MQYVIIVALLLVVIYLVSVETSREKFVHVVATPTSRPLPAILPTQYPAPGSLPSVVQKALDEYMAARTRVSALKTQLAQIEALRVKLKAAANNDYNAGLEDEMRRVSGEWKDKFRSLGFAIGKYNQAAHKLAAVQKTYNVKVIEF